MPNTNPIGADALRAVIAEMRSKEARGAEATEHELGEMADRLTQALEAPTTQAAPAAVAGQCEDAIELLGKYKELCEEIKRGDSYHLGRIDSAISVLAQTAPQPAVQQGGPVVWRSWDSENSRWNLTLWPDEWAGHADAWEPLYTQPAAPAAQGDAQQRAMDARHAAIYRWIIQHIDKAASIIDAWREDGEADKDELHDALAARAAKEWSAREQNAPSSADAKRSAGMKG